MKAGGAKGEGGHEDREGGREGAFPIVSFNFATCSRGE